MPDISDADSPAGSPPQAKARADEPKMLFYDAAGKRVSADDESAVRQFLSDDANRPDASKEERDESGAKPLSETDSKPVELLYYDAKGKRVSEPVSGGRQFTPEDPNRPDSAENKAAAKASPTEDQAADESDADTKAVKEPTQNKARSNSANK